LLRNFALLFFWTYDKERRDGFLDHNSVPAGFFLQHEQKETNIMEVQDILAEYGKDVKHLVPILQEIQSVMGYVSPDAQRKVAGHLNLPPSKVYGVVSFYNYFKINPPGRHRIHVCMGTACYVRGAGKLIDKIRADYGIGPGETSEDRRFSLEEVRCVGCCAIGPVLTVDDDVYGGMTPDELPAVLEKYEQR
jgi:NADH:ubiquinone oxidoreductase subunit E